MEYYVLVEEWLYPTESGRFVREETYDIFRSSENAEADETQLALDMAENLAEKAENDFFESTGLDPTPAQHYIGNSPHEHPGEQGYIVSCKNELDPYYYAARLIPMTSFDTPLNANRRA